MKKYIHFDDNDMQNYVDFIASMIPEKTMCSLYKNIGTIGKPMHMPLKDVSIPVDICIVDIRKRSLIIKIKAFGFSRNKEVMLSRHFSPYDSIGKVGKAVQSMFNEIIIDEKLDIDDIVKEFNIFKNIDFSKLELMMIEASKKR